MTDENELPAAGWGCPDCGHNHSGRYVPDGSSFKLYDGRCLNDIHGGEPGVDRCGCPRRRPEKLPQKTKEERSLELAANAAIFLASVDERLEMLEEKLERIDKQLKKDEDDHPVGKLHL